MGLTSPQYLPRAEAAAKLKAPEKPPRAA
jgi:hypothetical protein